MRRFGRASHPCTRLDEAANMPPLSHQPDEVFAWSSSQVADWLMAQPKIRQYVFEKCNRRGLIVFDPVTRTWRGKNFKPDSGAERYRF
ncbi:MAG: hypothetical protein WCL44_14590 [bacterium]